MIKIKHVAVFSAAAIGFVNSTVAEASCENPPIIPTPGIARDIYKAVAKGRNNRIKSGAILKVSDGGDKWVVFQYPKRLPRSQVKGGQNIVTVVAGGGGLEMTIGKCDGTISLSYSR